MLDAVRAVVRVEHRDGSSLRLPVPSGEKPDNRPQDPRKLRALRGEEIMIVIPAIDLKDGRCVRLFQGEMDQETVYFAEPLEAAKHWTAEGAELIHVVDLNGAVEGRPVHTREIAAICGNISVPIELGGGLRSRSASRARLSAPPLMIIPSSFAKPAKNFPARSSSASTRAAAR